MKLSAPLFPSRILCAVRTIKPLAIAMSLGLSFGIGPTFSAHAQGPQNFASSQRLIDLDFFAAGLKENARSVRPFIEKMDAAIHAGADIEAANAHGNNPLLNATYWAAWTVSDSGANDVVAFLLARGANPNREHSGMGNMTPMHIAAHSLWPNVELVELLCAAGAKANNLMAIPEDSFPGNDGPITVSGFPQVQEAIRACARKQ